MSGKMLTILSEVIEKHHKHYARINEELKSCKDPFYIKMMNDVLYCLESKSGNDILEKLFVEATGRPVKASSQKHGADSEDGELEAKPCKAGYSAHISDDSPTILLKHQIIPYLITGEASSKGQVINWMILLSYRKFDDLRYKKLLMNLPEKERSSFPDTLPSSNEERLATLSGLCKKWKQTKAKGIRSNPLAFTVIKALEPGEYCLWVNSSLTNEIPKEILELAKKQSPIKDSVELDCNAIKEFFDSAACKDYSSKSNQALKAICKEKGLKGFSNKSKDDLIKLILASESKTSPPQTDE
jgi:hypothetical protein